MSFSTFIAHLDLLLEKLEKTFLTDKRPALELLKLKVATLGGGLTKF